MYIVICIFAVFIFNYNTHIEHQKTRNILSNTFVCAYICVYIATEKRNYEYVNWQRWYKKCSSLFISLFFRTAWRWACFIGWLLELFNCWPDMSVCQQKPLTSAAIYKCNVIFEFNRLPGYYRIEYNFFLGMYVCMYINLLTYSADTPIT